MMEVNDEKLAVLKKTKALFVFISVLLSGYLLSRYCRTMFYIPFHVTETGELHYFPLQLGDLLELISWSFILPLGAFYMYNSNISKVELVRKGKKIMANTFQYLFYTAIILISAGNALHVFSNNLNGMMSHVNDIGYNSWDIFVLAYITDEFLSHSMMHVGILIIISIIVIEELENDTPSGQERIVLKNSRILSVTGFITGAFYAFSALEGQSALFISCFFIAFLIIIHLIYSRKYSEKEQKSYLESLLYKPNLMFLSCLVISFMVFVISWGFLFGFYVDYPFFKQPGDVF
ncbi:MAG: hypothetical protein ACTSVI_17390 [Promethearchaeota archaeon]